MMREERWGHISMTHESMSESGEADCLRQHYADMLRERIVRPLITKAMLEGYSPDRTVRFLEEKRQFLRGQGVYIMMKNVADELPAAERDALMDMQFDLALSEIISPPPRQ